MRHSHPIPTPYHCRTVVVSVDYDSERPGRVVVVDTCGNRGSMSIEGFEATCRPAPGAMVLGVEVRG